MIIKIIKILTIVSCLNVFGTRENIYNVELNSSQDSNYIVGEYNDYYSYINGTLSFNNNDTLLN